MIFDTNALSALAEGDTGAMQRLASASQAAIPVIVLGEYRFGIAQSRQKQGYQEWLEEIVAEARVLDVNEQTAIWYAEVRLELKEKGAPIPSNDLWIAALSRQHNLPILSRDRHFDRIEGVRRLDW